MSQIQDNTDYSPSEIASDDVQGKAMASLLDSHAQQLSMRTLKRLEEGRLLAMQQHAGQLSGYVYHDGTIASWFSWSQHPRLISAGVLCAVLVIGLTMTQHMNQPIENSDAFLLGAELPPEAFVDRGFEPWLNAKAEL